jgi:outer membrane protein assembly factor BamC
MLLSLSACGLFGGDERPVYQGAEYYKNLEVPPDLTKPDTGDQLVVPRATDEALQRFRDNNKLETSITPKFDGVRVVDYAGNSWIEIDNNVEHVWMRLLEFWQAEGIELSAKRPKLGYMETEWTVRADEDANFFSSMFQKFEPDQKDKFRVRLERFNFDEKTRVYVTHTRIERNFHGEDSDDYYWRTLPPNLEAERELLSRMALFAGLDDEQRLALLENYRPYSSLVRIDKANAVALTMTGSMEFVWRRAVRALDRMRMQEIKEDKSSRTIYFSVGEISDEDLDVNDSKDGGEEKDELAESSWLMQLLTGSDDEDIAKQAGRQYRLEFSELNERVQVEVKDAADSQATDEDGDVSGAALAEQIRNLLAKNLE